MIKNKITIDLVIQLVNNTITDYSQYDSETCCNGGNYSFSETLRYDEREMKFYITYGTSAEFSYCLYSGGFCNNSCEACNFSEPQYLTLAQLMEWTREQIKNLLENDNFSSSCQIEF